MGHGQKSNDRIPCKYLQMDSILMPCAMKYECALIVVCLISEYDESFLSSSIFMPGVGKQWLMGQCSLLFLHNKCFSWVTAVRVLSLAWSHNPPHLPRMPSNSVLISRPIVGAARILIWSYPSVFLPPVSTAIRTIAVVCGCVCVSSQCSFIYSIYIESA